MKKNFIIIAAAVLLVGALAFMGSTTLMACGQKSNATSASASGPCAGKTNAQTARADGSCASKASVQTASATSSSCTATCDSKVNATAASASGCCSKSNATNTSASGTCSKPATATNASYASAHECPHSKEACVNWLMANRDMTKVQAEAAYEHCAKSKSDAQAAVQLAAAEKTTESKAETESPAAPAGSSN